MTTAQQRASVHLPPAGHSRDLRSLGLSYWVTYSIHGMRQFWSWLVQAQNLTFAGALLASLGAIVSGVGAWMSAQNRAESERKLRMLAEEHSAMLTGGDSFCYVAMDSGGGDVGLAMLVHEGKYPVYDVRVRILDADQKNSPTYLDPYPNTLIKQDMGTIAPERDIPHPIGAIPLPQAAKRKKFGVLLDTRSGSFTETIFFQRIGNNWSRAWQVRKSSTKATLIEWADERFLRNAEGRPEFW